MNLKPNLWKISGSLIISIIVFIWLISTVKCSYNGGSCVVFSKEVIVPVILIFGLPTFILVYIIWSLIEKEKKRKKKMKKQLRKEWPLGFLGLLSLLGIPGVLTQDWLDMIWLVWVVWFVYFIPFKNK